MAHLIPSTFSKYFLTEEETLSASILTDIQVMNIKNKICDLAQSKLNLQPDPVSYNTFIAAEAELAGQLEALQWLLDESEAATQAVYLAASNSQSQGE